MISGASSFGPGGDLRIGRVPRQLSMPPETANNFENWMASVQKGRCAPARPGMAIGIARFPIKIYVRVHGTRKDLASVVPGP